MRILNETDREIAYELRGGPHMMTLSECDLSPGEEEVWESPYRHQLDCQIRIQIGDELLVSPVDENAVVHVRGGEGAYRLDV
jgi:hypothetical protein